MKTNRLSILLAAVGVAVFMDDAVAGRFECLRDLIPITDRATLGKKRKGVESPFFVNNRAYLVFPEIAAGRVSGFFMYGSKGAWYYDSIAEVSGGKTPIRELRPTGRGVYELVAQPGGLETVAILFLPGFSDSQKNKDGPVVLGASVLPVVGALVSRPELSVNLYSDPAKASDEEIGRWLKMKAPSRGPAAVDSDGKPIRTLVHLAALSVKDGKSLWEPLEHEFVLRRDWIKNHNLDERSFRNLTRVMDTTCRE